MMGMDAGCRRWKIFFFFLAYDGSDGVRARLAAAAQVAARLAWRYGGTCSECRIGLAPDDKI